MAITLPNNNLTGMSSIPQSIIDGLNEVYQQGRDSLMEVSTAAEVEQLLKESQNNITFKWAGFTGSYIIDDKQYELSQNNCYAINHPTDGSPNYIQRALYVNIDALPHYYNIESAQQALMEMPLDGTLCFYEGNSDEEDGTYTEFYATADGYDIECTVTAHPGYLLVSTHYEDYDEYGNLVRHYTWSPLAYFENTGAIHSEYEAYIVGTQEFDVTNIAKFTAHGAEIIQAYPNTLPDELHHNTCYILPDGKNYMLAKDETGNYISVNAELECDSRGFDCLVPVINSNSTVEDSTIKLNDRIVFTNLEFLWQTILEAPVGTLFEYSNEDSSLYSGEYKESIGCSINGWDIEGRININTDEKGLFVLTHRVEETMNEENWTVASLTYVYELKQIGTIKS